MLKKKVGCAPGQPDLGGVIPVHNRESELDDLKGPLQSKPFYDSMKMAIWYDTHFYFYPLSQISVHIEHCLHTSMQSFQTLKKLKT